MFLSKYHTGPVLITFKSLKGNPLLPTHSTATFGPLTSYFNGYSNWIYKNRIQIICSSDEYQYFMLETSKWCCPLHSWQQKLQLPLGLLGRSSILTVFFIFVGVIIITEGLSFSPAGSVLPLSTPSRNRQSHWLPAVWWSDWWRAVITRPTLIPARLPAADTHPAFVTVWDLNKQWSKAPTILGGAASTTI